MTDEGARKGEPRWSMQALRLPRLPLAVAAATTGLVCGLVATLLVWGGQHGCDAARGRPSCGGYGFLMLGGIVLPVDDFHEMVWACAAQPRRTKPSTTNSRETQPTRSSHP